MEYVFVTIIAPLPEGERGIKRFFHGVPDGAIYAAEIIDDRADVDAYGKGAAFALKRKIDRDGWPSPQPSNSETAEEQQP